jgi:hypothetical protein
LYIKKRIEAEKDIRKLNTEIFTTIPRLIHKEYRKYIKKMQKNISKLLKTMAIGKREGQKAMVIEEIIGDLIWVGNTSIINGEISVTHLFNDEVKKIQFEEYPKKIKRLDNIKLKKLRFIILLGNAPRTKKNEILLSLVLVRTSP